MFATLLYLNTLGGTRALPEPQIDQLRQELETASVDSVVIRLELQLSDSLLFHEPEQAIMHAQRALQLAEKHQDTLSCAEAFNNIGIVNTIQGKYLTGTENFQEALNHYEAVGNLDGASKILNTLGVIYQELNNTDQSIKHHLEGYNLDLEIQDYQGAAFNLYNITVAYLEMGALDSAFAYVQNIKDFQQLHGDYVSLDPILGSIHLEQNHLDSAEFYLQKALEDNIEVNDETIRISVTYSLAELAFKKKQFFRSLQYIKNIEPSIQENQFNEEQLNVHELKSKIFHEMGELEQALSEKERFISLKDSLNNINNVGRINELNAKYESEKREKEHAETEALLAEQKTNERFQKKLFLVIIATVFLVALILLISFLKKKKTNFILNQQNSEILEQRRKIISSINYAKKIQNSILIPENQIRRFLPESFVYFKPKDIVSGDFYWFSQIGDKFIIATIDCTGHGVPGAFMSLIANAKLNKVVNEKRIYDPGLILSEVHHEIFAALHQKDKSSAAQDGMDMSLCVIDQKAKQIHFAGAQNSIFLVHEENAREIKADSYSIGGSYYSQSASANFNTKTIRYDNGTYLYMYTDGYLDQFGGAENKKLNKTRFRDILLDLSRKGLQQAKLGVDQYFHSWKGNNKQIDDILIIGAKL
ncbi:MAG: tetratricopeptide repeat protein [Flavobacteriales bacterium]|nr:tetratricopeptide repeat protein [Flavobacteriales bacterium]